jgi:hypothetical protein
MIAPARILVEAWDTLSGSPLEGWLFPNPSGSRPLDMSAYANRTIRAILGERYKGLYSARRRGSKVPFDPSPHKQVLCRRWLYWSSFHRRQVCAPDNVVIYSMHVLAWTGMSFTTGSSGLA